AQHLEDRYEELLARGATDHEAFSAVLSELSDSELLKRELKRVESRVSREPVVLGIGKRNIMEDLLQDLRYGLRSMRRNPAFTLIALITLALGIGANTAIFSVVNGVLLRHLNYPEPDRLMMVNATRLQNMQDKIPLCQADFLDWKAQNQVFSNIAGFST